MFSVFGEGSLDIINTNASAAEITAWKQSRKTAECYAHLHQCPKGETQSAMARILEKVWPRGDATSEQVAFAIAICQTVLNPNNDIITIKEAVIKEKIRKYKVSFEEIRKKSTTIY